MGHRAVRLRVLSARHQDMTGDEAIINYLGQTGAGAWDNKIFTMWVHCQLGGRHDRGGGGVGESVW